MSYATISGLQDDDRYDDNGDIPEAPVDALAAMGLGPPIIEQYDYQPSSSGFQQETYQPPPQKSWSPPSQQSNSPAAAPSKYGGGGDKCPRCNKTVYFAEAREGPNNIKYHRLCFTCIMCRKMLDSTFTERQGDVYCKSCYSKEFGPKGFGFGGGLVGETSPSPDRPSAPAASTSFSGPSPVASKPMVAKTPPSAGSSSASSKYGGGGEKCPRCSKTVYFAEAREGPNNIKYHKACFVCQTCNKTLDSTYTERKGELFCKSCYAKDFGPAVFGFG